MGDELVMNLRQFKIQNVCTQHAGKINVKLFIKDGDNITGGSHGT